MENQTKTTTFLQKIHKKVFKKTFIQTLEVKTYMHF